MSNDYDQTDRSELAIVDEELLPIEHTLLALPGTQLEDLEVIQSHPVALQQCDRFLSALGHCRSESYWDTAAAAQAVAANGDSQVAAIAPAECAELFGLDILATAVADLIRSGAKYLHPRQLALQANWNDTVDAFLQGFARARDGSLH